MSEAPERIEIESECGHANTYNSEDRRTWLRFPDKAPDYFYAKYVRADRIEELEAKLAKAVEALGILADDTNWFDAVEEDGTLSPAWRGTGSPDEIARATLAELKGGSDA